MTKILLTFPNKVEYSLLEAVIEAMSYCPEEYNITEIKDDNPVPQLNINMIDKFVDEYYDIESSCLSKHNKIILKDFINWLNFQKGVENSNEQPIG